MRRLRTKPRAFAAVLMAIALVSATAAIAQNRGTGGGGSRGGGSGSYGGGGSRGGSFDRLFPCRLGACKPQGARIVVAPAAEKPVEKEKPRSSKPARAKAPKASASRKPPPPKVAKQEMRTRASKPAVKKPARSPGVTPQGQIAGRDFRADEVLVEIPSGTPQGDIDALAAQNRIEKLGSEEIRLLNTRLHRWRITDGRSPEALASSLRKDRRVADAQPNRVFTLQQAVAGGAHQYPAEKLMLQKVHSLTRGASVSIALIDSGADPSHPELAGVITEEFDAVGGTFTPHAHGTGMAGAIAAHAQITGAAPEALILNVRAFAPEGSDNKGTTYDIVRGIDWAAQRGAKVFNLSFAGPRDPLLSRAIKQVRDGGSVVVAAAGNAGPESPPLYPAAEAGVIAVTATDLADEAMPMANRGSYVTIAAPGVDILLPSTGGAYAVSSGTSIATAYVSGVAALLIARHPETNGTKVYEVLARTARDLGPLGKDRDFGVGMVQPIEALGALEASPSEGNLAAR